MASGQYSKVFIVKSRTMQWLYSEKIRKEYALKNEFYQNFFLFIIKSSRTSKIQKSRALFLQKKTNVFHYKTKIVRRCLNSGRTHNVTSRYLLARMQFRHYMHLGKLPNVMKYVR